MRLLLATGLVLTSLELRHFFEPALPTSLGWAAHHPNQEPSLLSSTFGVGRQMRLGMLLSQRPMLAQKHLLLQPLPLAGMLVLLFLVLLVWLLLLLQLVAGQLVVEVGAVVVAEVPVVLLLLPRLVLLLQQLPFHQQLFQRPFPPAQCTWSPAVACLCLPQPQ